MPSLNDITSLPSHIHALPWKREYPSHCVGKMRDWLPDYLERQTQPIAARTARTYGQRLRKAVSVCSIGLAILPLENELVANGAYWGAAKLTSLPRYQRVRCPLIRRPVPSWVLLGAAFVCVGTSGAPAIEAADGSDPQPGSAPAEADEAADLASLDMTNAMADGLPHRLRDAALAVLRVVNPAMRFGVLGMLHEALDAQALRCTQSGRDRLAWGCRTGAALMRVVLEPARLLLQSGSLILELGLSAPFAALGAILGACVFLSDVHLDRWGEVQHGVVMT